MTQPRQKKKILLFFLIRETFNTVFVQLVSFAYVCDVIER